MLQPKQPPFAAPSAAKYERHQIRLLGTISGGAILLYLLMQNILVGLLMLAGCYNAYQTQPLLQAGTDILLVLLCLLLPFLCANKLMTRISDAMDPLPLDAPKRKGDLLLAIPAGVGFCIVADIVSSYLVDAISSFGLELSSPNLPMPQGILGVTVSFFRVVVVAAMAEELCFRGVVMGNLRRYGDWFAIAMASLVFALMHCNLVQAPFALIVGFALGYLSIRTGTLWTGILIHAANNTISLVASYLMEALDEKLVALLYAAVTDTLLLVGAVCLFLLLRRKTKPLRRSDRWNSFSAKTGAFLLNPTMLIALALMIWFTGEFVKKAG